MMRSAFLWTLLMILLALAEAVKREPMNSQDTCLNNNKTFMECTKDISDGGIKNELQNMKSYSEVKSKHCNFYDGHLSECYKARSDWTVCSDREANEFFVIGLALHGLCQVSAKNRLEDESSDNFEDCMDLDGAEADEICIEALAKTDSNCTNMNAEYFCKMLAIAFENDGCPSVQSLGVFHINLLSARHQLHECQVDFDQFLSQVCDHKDKGKPFDILCEELPPTPDFSLLRDIDPESDLQFFPNVANKDNYMAALDAYVNEEYAIEEAEVVKTGNLANKVSSISLKHPLFLAYLLLSTLIRVLLITP